MTLSLFHQYRFRKKRRFHAKILKDNIRVSLPQLRLRDLSGNCGIAQLYPAIRPGDIFVQSPAYFLELG